MARAAAPAQTFTEIHPVVVLGESGKVRRDLLRGPSKSPPGPGWGTPDPMPYEFSRMTVTFAYQPSQRRPQPDADALVTGVFQGPQYAPGYLHLYYRMKST